MVAQSTAPLSFRWLNRGALVITGREWRGIEIPTCLIAVVIYGSWLLTTWQFHSLPWWLHVVFGGGLLAWHSALQHETIHGHPTPWPWVNAALGGVSLSLWLPYDIYREAHLAHHENQSEDPLGDPATLAALAADPGARSRMGLLARAFYWVYATLVGHIVLYPFVAVWRLLGSETARLVRGDRSHLPYWVLHLISATMVLWWLVMVCEIPLWAYLLAYVYPGLALTSLRVYAEHRSHPAPAQGDDSDSIVVIESKLLGLLFLNNNLHALHHEMPNLPWYRYPELYRARRHGILRRNGNYWFPSYLSLFRQYAFRGLAAPVAAETSDLVAADITLTRVANTAATPAAKVQPRAGRRRPSRSRSLSDKSAAPLVSHARRAERSWDR